MDDRRCRDFFLHPTQSLHRRFAALRAVFVDHRPVQEVADEFGYSYGTCRNFVVEFRRQCQDGHLPPFSRSQPVGDQRTTTLRGRTNPSLPPSLISSSLI
jgi:hypothetical protein